jgi:hypothetical protein
MQGADKSSKIIGGKSILVDDDKEKTQSSKRAKTKIDFQKLNSLLT